MTRALIAAVIVEHVLFIVRPLDVLAPVDAGHIGRLLLHGHLPYRDFGFEYPPLAALAFLLPGLAPRALAGPALALQATVLEAVVVWFVVRPRGMEALRNWAVLSLLAFPFLSGGFDAFPMAAIAVSTALLVAGNGAGWWVAGAGALVKLSPAGAWAWGRTRGPVAVAALAVTIAVGVVPVLMARHVDDTYVGWTVHRGVQVESVAATTSWLWDRAHAHEPQYHYRFRAWELDGVGGHALVWAALALAGLVLLARRARHVDPWLASFAVVLLLLIGSKVLSPQYVVWGAPLAAVLGGRWLRGYALVTGLTVALFLTGGSHDAFMTVALLRNLALVCLAGASLAAVLEPRPQAVHLAGEVVA